MPELPEVETIRRQLAPALSGKLITRLEVLDPKWASPLAADELASLIEGRTIERLDRRGKYLIFALGDEFYLICHLRMTGNFLLEGDSAAPYQRAVFELEGGKTLRFTDPRRFGTAEVIVGDESLERYFASRLGIEPLSGALDGAALRALASEKRTSVKAFLLDQRAVAGIGNIYADEALFRAKVHPMREAGRLKPAQYALLATTIQDALQAGLDAGGATIDDFVTPTDSTAASKTSFSFTGARASLARAAATRFERWSSQGEGPTFANAVKRARGGPLSAEQLV